MQRVEPRKKFVLLLCCKLLQQCLILTSGRVHTTKLGPHFQDSNSAWHVLHSMDYLEVQDSTDDLVIVLLVVLEAVEQVNLEVQDNADSLVVKPVVELGNMDVQHSTDHLIVEEVVAQQGNQ